MVISCEVLGGIGQALLQVSNKRSRSSTWGINGAPSSGAAQRGASTSTAQHQINTCTSWGHLKLLDQSYLRQQSRQEVVSSITSNQLCSSRKRGFKSHWVSQFEGVFNFHQSCTLQTFLGQTSPEPPSFPNTRIYSYSRLLLAE
eukprot:1970992-Amphidinium_carterae.1